FLRGRVGLLAEAVQIAEIGEELFRIANFVDAELQLKHIARHELNLDALAGRKSSRGRKGEAKRGILRTGTHADQQEREDNKKLSNRGIHCFPRRMFQR